MDQLIPPLTSPVVEGVLEKLWCAREDGLSVRQAAPEGKLNQPAIDQTVSAGLAAWHEAGLVFTRSGERVARSRVRRQRLAEELLRGILEVKPQPVGAAGGRGRETDGQACGVEPVLSEPVTERICTFLGHPVVCPHGKAIPPGECCTRHDRLVEPLVERLTALEPGGEGRIVFMAPGRQLERLMALGLVPGAHIKLLQNKPACVVQVGETTLAVDEEVLAQIDVRPSLKG